MKKALLPMSLKACCVHTLLYCLSNPIPCTFAPLAITLNFSGCYYECTSGVFGTTKSQPPQATVFNYLYQASATGDIGNLVNANAYICQIQIKNDQPASNPVAPCSNAATQNFTWSTPGPTEYVQGFINDLQDVTVDYYDVCGLCSSTSNARPLFIGKAILPTGTTATPIQMITQTPYTTSNCQ